MRMEKRGLLSMWKQGAARGVSSLFARCPGLGTVVRLLRLRGLAERVLPGHGGHVSWQGRYAPGHSRLCLSCLLPSHGLRLLAGVCLLWLWFAVAGLFISPPKVYGANYKPLPDTGQTKCYDTKGNEITCPSPGQPLYGQDANYHGLQRSFTKHENYNNTGDDVTIDNNTGLMWMTNTADTNSDGKIDENDEMEWQAAVDYCAALTYAGFSDWRLPSAFELETIVDNGRYGPAIDTSAFSCESSVYWSSTSYASNPGSAWGVDFYGGGAGWLDKDSSYSVRCVRGGL